MLAHVHYCLSGGHWYKHKYERDCRYPCTTDCLLHPNGKQEYITTVDRRMSYYDNKYNLAVCVPARRFHRKPTLGVGKDGKIRFPRVTTGKGKDGLVRFPRIKKRR